MQTFLIDTCIWSYRFSEKRKEHANVIERVQELAPDSILGISIITWGEVVYGHKAVRRDKRIQAEYLQFIISKGPKMFYVDDRHTATAYGELRASLFEKYAPKDKRRPNTRPEQLIDPVTSSELGIQENDLWIAAQTIVKNLTLVTDDKLSRIREVAGADLHIENWAKSPDTPTRS